MSDALGKTVMNIGLSGSQAEIMRRALLRSAALGGSIGEVPIPIEIILEKQTPKVPDLNEPPQVWIKTNKPMLLEVLTFVSKIENAVGMAANQLNWKGSRLMQKFFVRRLGNAPKSPCEVVIDPTVIERYGEPVTELEGCLSWPGKTILAKRHLKIKVSYWTIDGQYIENEILERFNAQVWQHEMDHLDGIEENVQKELKPFVRETPKVGRNDACPCGSNLKYKKCCCK